MTKQKLRITVILSLLTLLTNNSTYGQFVPNRSIHEFTIYGSGGLSTFRYDLSDGNGHSGIGSNFGVGYTLFVNRQWGVHSGAGLGMYNTRVKADNAKIVSTNLIDEEGDRFNMHTTIFDFNEKQKAMYLNIPVMAIYQRNIQESLFYVMGGFKLGIPISGKYASTSTKLENASYYPDYDNWAFSQEFAGNGSFDDKRFNGKFKPGVSLMLSLETGTKFNIHEYISLSVGAFFDGGLNNVSKDKPFISYNAKDPSDFNASLFSVADKTKVIAAGIILRLHFDYLFFKSEENRRYPYTNPYQGR